MNDSDLVLLENSARSAFKCLSSVQGKMVEMPFNEQTARLKASYSTALGSLKAIQQEARAIRELQ